MNTIDVQPRGPQEYAVTVTQGDSITEHLVRVPRALRDELGLGEPDETRWVRESFVFLLDREPATAILRQFSLDVISRYFPEYIREIRKRLA